ncbi:hypothetical protein Btru_064609 [Bulinus truncatus]|nr:hypothetical protein Btru_064609 [Bulinus truncatus]
MDPEDAADVERLLRDKRRAEAKNKLSDVAQLCNCVGEIYSKYGRHEDAIKEHTQERHLSEALGDEIGEAIACRKIGECHCALGQYSEALELQKRHLTLARECGNHLEEQRAWATIGRTYLCQTETRNLQEATVAGKKAEKAFVKALEICEKVKESVKPAEYMAMKGRLYLNLGHVFDARGDVNTSADMLKRAITIAQKFKLEDELYLCNVGLATMYQKNCQYSQALRFLEVAIKLADKLRDKVRERELFVQKAKVHVCVGDFLAAKHCMKKAHKLKVDSEITEEELSKIFRSVNKMQEVIQDLETETEEKNISKHLEVVADCFVELGNYKEAIENYLKVLQYANLMTNEERAAIYMSLGQTYADINQYDNAIQYYRLELSERKDNFEQSCQTLLNIADLEELKGSKYGEVCKVYMSAFDAARKAKSPKLQVQTLKSLICLQKACKQATHLQETEKKLDEIKNKYNLRSTPDNQSDEEDVGRLPGARESDGDISLSDLTLSDESDGDQDCPNDSIAVSRKKSKVARRNEKGETPLHRACIEGNLKKVKSLISEGHPINPRDYCGWLPLHEACNHGHLAVVENLLDCGAWINDRGGERCGGVTPLIDAANCGNLDIVRLLVERGANLMAKDDDGNTALDSLHAWYSRTCDMLGANDSLEYQTTESLLKSKMGKEKNPITIVKTKEMGQALNRKSTFSPEEKIIVRLPDLTDGSSDSEEDLTKTEKMPLKDRRKKRCAHISTSRDKKSLVSDEENSDFDSVQSRLHASFSNIKEATHLYRSAIENVGSSAQKRFEVDSSVELIGMEQQHSQSPQSALVNADDDIGDTWLIEDIRVPKNKKKSAAAKNILNTNSYRTSRILVKKRSRPHDMKDVLSRQHSPKKSKCCDKLENVNSLRTVQICSRSKDADLNDYSNEACPVSSSTGSRQDASKSSYTAINYFWDSDDEMLSHVDTFYEEPTDFNVRETSPVLYSRGKYKKIDDVVKSDSADSSILLRDTAEKTKSVITADPPSLTRDITEKPTYKNSLRVKVKFGEQTILIPIQPSDQIKTISWLTLQAQQRYFNMFLLLPTLTLSTQDNTILCPGDIISTVLLDNDVLTADVISWERPKLEVRYEQACARNLMDINKHVSLALKQSDSSGKLQLKDFSLGASGLQPVFQALEGQKSLTELCLSGNRLGDSGLTSLMKVISNLPVLKSLDLDTNSISAEGVQLISLTLKTELCLQTLTHLSLAHNCIGDIASETFGTLLKNLPNLKSLNLSACSFTHLLFTPSFCDAMKGCKLENVCLAENQIRLEGMKHLLQSLRISSLMSLDISHSRTSCDGDIGGDLEKFISDEECQLQELVVTGCHLSHSDISVLNRLPASCRPLRSLNVSQNHNINNKTLQKLFYLSTGCGSLLEELTARGCSVASPLGAEFLEAFKAKMLCRFPLKKFIFTCRGLQPSESSALSDIWTQQWKNEGTVKIVGAAVSLTVSSF